jgi:hypothetical protein
VRISDDSRGIGGVYGLMISEGLRLRIYRLQKILVFTHQAAEEGIVDRGRESAILDFGLSYSLWMPELDRCITFTSTGNTYVVVIALSCYKTELCFFSLQSNCALKSQTSPSTTHQPPTTTQSNPQYS